MTSTTEHNRTSTVGSWRVDYAPGDWLVACGPASLVALSPGLDVATVARLWEAVVAASDIEELLGELAQYGSGQVPGMAVFFWSDGELRTLVRGDVRIVDGTGAAIVQTERVRTWTETGLGGVREVLIGLGQEAAAPAGPDLLPLVVGVVRAGRLRLNATDSALLRSPQLGGAPTPTGGGNLSGQQSSPVSPRPGLATTALDAPQQAAPEPSPAPDVPPAPVTPIGRASTAPTPYSDARTESSTPPEPESQAPYPQPEGEPNGATAPEVAASSRPTEPRPTQPWDPDLPETVIGPSLGESGQSRDRLPATGDHLGQPQFGGSVPSLAAAAGAAPSGARSTGAGSVDPNAVDTGVLGPGAFDPSVGDSDRADTGALDTGLVSDSASPRKAASLGAAASSDDSEPTDDVVLAVLCSRGHPNPPDMRFCRWCRSTIARQQPQTIAAPVLAVLRPSVGDAVPLRQPTVIGRAPSAARVADGSAYLLTVPSPSQDISRSHVQVTPEGWDVTVTDLQSTNGTILIAPGNGSDRRRLLPGQPVTVEPGSVLDLGDGVTIGVDAPNA